MISKQDRGSLIVGIVVVAAIALGALLYWEHSNHPNTSGTGGGVAQVNTHAAQAPGSEQHSEIADDSKRPLELPKTGDWSAVDMSSRESAASGTDTRGENTETKAVDNWHPPRSSVTGCIVDEAGQHLLEGADGKLYLLDNSEQFHIRAGEEVIVHGTIGKSGSTLDLPSRTHAHSIDSEINVTKVDVISDTCKLEHKHSKQDQKHPLDNLPPN